MLLLMLSLQTPANAGVVLLVMLLAAGEDKATRGAVLSIVMYLPRLSFILIPSLQLTLQLYHPVKGILKSKYCAPFSIADLFDSALPLIIKEQLGMLLNVSFTK